MNSSDLSFVFNNWIERAKRDYDLIRGVEITFTIDPIRKAYVKICIRYDQKELNFQDSFKFPLHPLGEHYPLSSSLMMRRLLEFKSSLSSLSAIFVLQLETILQTDVPVIVDDPESCPDLILAEEYFRALNEASWNYERLLQSSFRLDTRQLPSLQELALKPRDKENKFNLTDRDIHRIGILDLNEIRELLIKYEVPITFSDGEIWRGIKLNGKAYVTALQREIRQLERENKKVAAKHRLILQNLLFDHLQGIKSEMERKQKREYLKNLPISKGDLIQLKDKRLAILESLEMASNNILQISYRLLKEDLTGSKRGSTVGAEHICSFLPAQYLHIYKEENIVKRIRLLQKWFQKRKREIILPPFQLDIVKG